MHHMQKWIKDLNLWTKTIRCFRHKEKWKHVHKAFIVVVFIICKAERTHISTTKRTSKERYSISIWQYSATKETVPVHATTQMQFELITLGKVVKQTKKATYCMAPLTWNVQNRQIHRHTKMSSCQGLGVKNRQTLLMGTENLTAMKIFTNLWIYCNHKFYTLIYVNFISKM